MNSNFVRHTDHVFRAQNISKGFTDSVVLTQDSAGVSLLTALVCASQPTSEQHCSSAAASLCTAKAIREYFRDGKLPAAGTVCKHESTIFPSKSRVVEARLSGEDKEIMDVWRELSGSIKIPQFGLTF